jgi:hypothetical protein
MKMILIAVMLLFVGSGPVIAHELTADQILQQIDKCHQLRRAISRRACLARLEECQDRINTS